MYPEFCYLAKVHWIVIFGQSASQWNMALIVLLNQMLIKSLHIFEPFRNELQLGSGSGRSRVGGTLLTWVQIPAAAKGDGKISILAAPSSKKTECSARIG